MEIKSTEGIDYILAEADCYLDNIPLQESSIHYFLDNYTLQDLSGSNLEVVKDAQKNGLCFPLEITAETMPEFLVFGRRYFATATVGQVAALFHASRSNGQYVLVTRSSIIAEIAQELEVPFIGISSLVIQSPSDNEYPPVFRDVIDERKVAATLRKIKDEKDSPLNTKAYWIVPIKVFKQYDWTCCSQKALMEWFNRVLNLNPQIKESDMKYALNNINAKAKTFWDWPNNTYRDFAYKIYDVFLGEEEPWGTSGRFVYKHEKNFTKQNIEIPHRKE